MKKILLATLITIFFASCNNGKNVIVFEIGDTREHVLNTLEKDFTFKGEHWSKSKILEEESVIVLLFTMLNTKVNLITNFAYITIMKPLGD